MLIGELSRRSGVSPRMLRYYEQQGLLHPVRRDSGYRAYDETALKRVDLVRRLLEAGLTSRIVQDLLPCFDRPAAHANGVDPATVDTVRAHLATIDGRIETLTRHRDGVAAFLRAVDAVAAATGPGSGPP